MTRYRVEWQTNGVEYFDIAEEEGLELDDIYAIADDAVQFGVPKSVEFDLFVEGETAWEQV